MRDGPDRAPAAQWGSFTLVVLLAGITVAIAVSSLLPARRDLHRTQTLLAERAATNDALAERATELRDEIDALQNDPWHLLRVQREELNLREPGELRVR